MKIRRMRYLKKQIIDDIAGSIMGDYEEEKDEPDFNTSNFMKLMHNNSLVHFIQHPSGWANQYFEELNISDIGRKDYEKKKKVHQHIFVDAWNQFANKIQEA